MNDKDIVTQATEYLQAMTRLGKFSGSVLLARDGAVVHSAGYSFADREHGVANTPSTKFRVGSITKQFTAMAILILEEQGKLNVHDPVRKHLAYSPSTWNAITIHQMLNHTSGLRNLTSYIDHGATARMPLSLPEVIDVFREKRLDFRPGTEYRYSNSGYILLGDIIERASGMPYEEFLRAHILDPLAMADTGYDHNESILPNRATSYGKPGGQWLRSGYCDMGFPFAAGALYSTVEDLFRWDQALTAGRLISRESYERMTAVTPLLSSYGYGFSRGREYNRNTVSHSGGINGFRADFVRYPEESACVIVLCNSEAADFRGVSKTLGAILFGESYTVPPVKEPVALSDEVLARYRGDYAFVPGVSLHVDSGNGRLIARSGNVRREFLSESETAFFQEECEDGMTFHLAEDGEVSHLTLRQSGSETVAKKLLGKDESYV